MIGIDARIPQGNMHALQPGLGRPQLLFVSRHDPLREEAHETLIRVYGASGSRSQVHRQFRRLRVVLEREIGVEPLPQTIAAYRLALAATVERSRLQAASSVFAPRPGLAAFAART